MFLDDEVHQEDGIQDTKGLFETFFVDHAERLSDDDRKELLESAEVQALVEANAISRKTIVRLSKSDDYARRITLAAMQKAKETNSSDWKRLKKAHALKKQAIANIVKKYGTTVKRDVVKAQRAVLKSDPKHYTQTNFHL